ncbi:MAG: NUDIX hydrolase [Prolixibacteraceae bacterium]|nr:NUDIX hydrolase [Prolixibacteraceae bacterium]
MTFCYKYPRPALTTDAIIIANEKGKKYILLIERGIEPFMGMWALPGGFIEMDEELDEACARELKEETGIEGLHLELFTCVGTIGRDPRGRTISVIFSATIPERIPVASGDDAARAKWFLVENLPELAFDHSLIIRNYFQKD